MVAGDREGRRSAVLVLRHPTAAPTEWTGGPTAVDAPRAYSRRQKENSASNEEEQPVLLRGETHASCRTLAYGFTRARSLPTCFSLRMKMAFCTADASSDTTSASISGWASSRCAAPAVSHEEVEVEVALPSEEEDYEVELID